MKSILSLLAILLILLPLAPASAPAATPAEAGAIKEAGTATLSWLSLIDQGRYDESLSPICSYVKRSFTVEKWAAVIASNRGTAKRLLSRKLNSSQYFAALPDAPAGEYIVSKFASSFAEKPDAIETVTCMRDADGAWRVAGYYIK